MVSIVIRVGGEAGWGIATAASILARVGVKLGYHVFESKDYSSRIKGGHNYHTVRISDVEVGADVSEIDLLLALDKFTLEKHDAEIILDEEKVGLRKIGKQLGKKNIRNAVFVGAAGKVLGIDFVVLEEVVGKYFEKKPKVKDIFIRAMREGYSGMEKKRDLKLLRSKSFDYVGGNEAICLGALQAGLGFHVQYPMTPVSGMLHYLAKEAVKREDLVVVQPEDEIAAINMALGASYAGKRAMTATSGGGFSLMVESLSLAGMAEVPLVIVEGQRPGPATGVPTKTEQGDLKFVLSAGHGEFPRIVVAPGSIEECYGETKRAFYLAEKYSVPVIVLVDKHLAESFKTVELKDDLGIDFSQRFNVVENVGEQDLEGGLFKRYAGLKRTLPGFERGMYTCTGDEHDETGLITEDKEIRERMMEKRMKKLDLIKEELPVPELIGPDEANLTVVSWGSNKGAINEAVERLDSEGKKIAYLCLKYLCPFPTEKVKERLENKRNLVLVENNYSGQLGELIMEKTGIEIKDKILKYNGQTFTVDEIYEELQKRC